MYTQAEIKQDQKEETPSISQRVFGLKKKRVRLGDYNVVPRYSTKGRLPVSRKSYLILKKNQKIGYHLSQGK